MSQQDVSIVICGAAGQGIKTVEEMLVGILKQSGYHVFATKEYESRVRGGINSTELRIGAQRVHAFVNRIDILIALKAEALTHLQSRIDNSTIIIADVDLFGEELISNLIKIPLVDMAKEIGNKVYSNVIAAGAISGIFNTEKSIAESFLSDKFQKKGDKVVAENIEAFKKGYEKGRELSTTNQVHLAVEQQKGIENEVLFNGNEAVGLGAIAGGCNFISAYPMSPSTGVLITLAHYSKEFNIVVDQCEDEIAGMNKAIGAWFAGARAIVSTSGGGFALMEEGLSLAGMMESPLVVHIAQRPGPATGLPTRTGQEDLNLVLHAGHGEFARIIFAPGTITQAFYLTQKAFNIADKYQVPVFILTDQYFVDTYYNFPNLDLTKIKVEKYFIETAENYKRYSLTESGISPRGIPGYGSGLVRADSDEHDEAGQITEDMDIIRPKMVEKRFHKRMSLLAEIAELPTRIGSESAENLIISWGSNYHAIEEAIQQLNRSDLALLHFHQVFPLHPDVEKLLKAAKKVYLIESNAQGQFRNVLRLYANFTIPIENCFFRYAGKPLAVEEVTEFISREEKR